MIISSLRLRSKVLRLGLLLHLPSTRPISTSTATRMAKFDEELLGDGYYAVNVGSTIRADGGAMYEAVRKLGWGVNSTVWMGRNYSDVADPKYVALKILTKVATREHESSQTSELQMLLRTMSGQEPEHRPRTPSYQEQGLNGPPHPGWSRVSGLLGAFSCGDSQHLVIESPLYGEHMKDYARGEPDRRLSPALVKKIARETLLALDYLHSHCGIIHSDVKPENILRDFNLGPQVDDIIEAIKRKEPDFGRDGRSAPLWVPHVEGADWLHVVLADLSHASWKDLITRSTRNIGSPALKAPELVMGFAYTTAIDIWAFGCTIFELLAGKSLFGFSDSSRSPNELIRDPQYHLNLMQSLVGEPLFPEAAEGTMTIEKGFINSDGWIKVPTKGDTLNERIANCLPNVQDKDMLAEFLRRCLKLDPVNRASASELMDEPWLASD